MSMNPLILNQLMAQTDAARWETIVKSFHAISSIFIFLGLYVAILLIYKILSWSSLEAQMVGRKLKLFIWVFTLSLTIWWLLLDLPEFNTQALLVKISWCILIFTFFMFIMDFFNYMFFDIYYPRVRGTRIPQIVSNLSRVVYFLAIWLFIFGVVLGYNIKPLLTGSAILTAIIGLALQDTLSNLFSGLTMHLSKPFEIGQWIKVGELEGMVVRIEWRSTTIKTREEDYVSIPNSHLSKVDFVNYSTPTSIHGIYIEVGVGYQYAPNMIKKILVESATVTPGVVKEIIPDIFLTVYNDFSIDYRMRFYVNNYAMAPLIRSAVMERIWYNFQRNDVVIPFPIRDVYMKETQPAINREETLQVLRRIDFMQDLKEEEIKDVAGRIKLLMYSQGEEIIRQGTEGDTFYILKSGTVKVVAKNEKGEVFLSKELESGNFFGEIAVLTGEPRTASIIAITDVELYMLNKEDFEYLLNKYEDLDLKISQKIAARQKFSFEQMEVAKHAFSQKEAEEMAQKKVDSLSQQILNKIRTFIFGDKKGQ